MPKLYTDDISKVVLRDGTSIDIEPGSFVPAPVDFYARVEGQDDAYTGMSYLGYKFINSATSKLMFVATDCVLAVEFQGEEVVDG